MSSKNRALDIKAHEEMFGESKLYYNAELDKWAVSVSGKVDHEAPKVKKLGEGWICKP
jgi:hypothetical protein